MNGNECFHSAISDQIFGGTPASPPIQVGSTRLAPKSHLASGREIGKGTKIVVVKDIKEEIVGLNWEKSDWAKE